MQTLKSGVLAFYDSMRGPVPVKVSSVIGPCEKPVFDLGYGQAKASIKVCATVTEDHSPYKKGEVLDGSSINFFPRKSLRRRDHSMTIDLYAVEVDVPIASA